MTERVILPREADADMLLAGQKSIEASVIGALRGEPHIAEGAAYRAMLAASPNAGEVTEEELEKMLAAKPFEDGDETVEKIIVLGLAACGFKLPSTAAPDVIRAALSSLGIKVGG